MSAILSRTIPQEVEILLSGSEVAELFWDLDDHDQAEFFNYIGRLNCLPFQLQAVTDCGTLMPEGRAAMAKFGEYSQPTDTTNQ